MEDYLNIFNGTDSLSVKKAESVLRSCNEYTAPYGLRLDERDISELVSAREAALKALGRVEFGEGILPKIIYVFASSPYIWQENYSPVLFELQDTFYNFKNEAGDLFPDCEIIESIEKVFNGRAQGSTEYLSSLSLEALLHYSETDFDERDADDAGDLF